MTKNVLIDFDSSIGRYDGISRATYDDANCLSRLDLTVNLWHSRRYKQLFNDDNPLYQIPNISLDQTRPTNSKIWFKSFLNFKVDTPEADYIYLNSFFGFKPKNAIPILRLFDPFIFDYNPKFELRKQFRRLKNGVARNSRNSDFLKIQGQSVHVYGSKIAAENFESFYGFAPNQMAIIPCAVGETRDFEEKISFQSISERPYFLIIGGQRQRKNPIFAINAWAKSPVSRKLNLRVVGRVPHHLLNSYAQSHLSSGSLVFHSEISQIELEELVLKARALVYVMIKGDGFARPIAEALISGTPIICNDLDIFREIAGSHASYFPSEDESSLIDLMGIYSDAPPISKNLSIWEYGKQFSYAALSQKWMNIFLDS